nr:MAG TPA: tail fiber protein [Caudoviricetes sp.]
MSKKSWYNRSHQFTPYTKADGQAVSDEFDAIQTSFERIPEMRDDGRGFKESPLIPEPTDPMHPVPLKMLTETEKSVNNARDDVTDKAQQVAQNTQSVATNTLTATQKADTATQAAASAQSSQQAAGNYENMARKWASNPVNEVVQGDKYSSYHYATKAEQSATTASSAAVTSKSNADIATSKAEEAVQAANRATSIANGEVDYSKVINVPSANTENKGIVQLTSSIESDSEELGLTAKAGKYLASLIAKIPESLVGYIKTSSMSSRVDSDSEKNVATSASVKTAYDKGTEAKNAADSANNNANNRVAKTGDTMTGILNLNREDALLRWQRNGVNKFAVGFRNTISEDLLLYNYAFNTEFALREHDLYCNKPLNLPGALFENGDYAGFNIKNSSGRYVRVEGNPHSSGTMVTFVYREASGANIHVVSLPKKNGTILLDSDISHAINGTNKAKVASEFALGELNKTKANLVDFSYQKIGNFEIRKYPDGTMIQTYFVDFNDVHGANSGLGGPGPKQLTWAVSFVGKPLVFGNITSSIDDSHDVGVSILTKSTGTTLYWYNYEHSNPNQGACRLQFLAIGRWK